MLDAVIRVVIKIKLQSSRGVAPALKFGRKYIIKCKNQNKRLKTVKIKTITNMISTADIGFSRSLIII